jgi:hypothetical protein
MIAFSLVLKGLVYTGVTPTNFDKITSAADACSCMQRTHVSVSCLSVSISITKHFIEEPIRNISGHLTM